MITLATILVIKGSIFKIESMREYRHLEKIFCSKNSLLLSYSQQQDILILVCVTHFHHNIHNILWTEGWDDSLESYSKYYFLSPKFGLNINI